MENYLEPTNSKCFIKLVKVEECNGGCEFKGIAHTVIDCEGFYQLDLCYCDGSECYKILVSRAVSKGNKAIISKLKISYQNSKLNYFEMEVNL